MSMLLSFITGSGLKMLAGIISGYMSSKREEKMLLINADLEKMKVLFGGELETNTFLDWTRRILAFMFAGTLCFCVLYIVIASPNQMFHRVIDKNPSFFADILFGSVSKTTIPESGGALLWDFVNFSSAICGFYFTKIRTIK